MKATIKATSKEIATLIIELQGRQAAPVYETITPELKLSLDSKVQEQNKHRMNSQVPSREGGSATEIGAILKLNADDMIKTLDKVTQKTEELAERLEHIHQLQKELTT